MAVRNFDVTEARLLGFPLWFWMSLSPGPGAFPFASIIPVPFREWKIKIWSEQSVSDFAAGTHVGVKYTHF